MDCPVCKGLMWDNTNNKKSPTSPDYTCKNKECKWSQDRKTKEYVQGQYTTAVWLPKEQAPAPAPAPAPVAGASAVPQKVDMSEVVTILRDINSVLHTVFSKELIQRSTELAEHETAEPMPTTDTDPDPTPVDSSDDGSDINVEDIPY